MRNLLRSGSLFVGLCLSLSGAASRGDVIIRALEPLPGDFISQVHGVSGDGGVIVGRSVTVGGVHAVKWSGTTAASRLAALDVSYLAEARGASLHGDIIAGNSWPYLGYGSACRWAGSGPEDLGLPLGGYISVANAISADGVTVAGWAEVNGQPARATTWTASQGWRYLAPAFLESQGTSVSADGSVVVGWHRPTPGSTLAFRWTEARGFENLDAPPGGDSSNANGVSGNGRVVVGWSTFELPDSRAFRWTRRDGFTNLGTLGGGFSSAAAVSGNGSVIVGQSTLASGAYAAFIWKSSLGMVDLGAFLAENGVPMTGWILQSATAVSADGRTIAGDGFYNGEMRGFVATIPAPGAGSAIVCLAVVALRRRR